MRVVSLGPVAGIPVVHHLGDGIELERRDAIEWAGTEPSAPPIVIHHEVGDAAPTGMRRMLEVPPWCTFYLDARGEPAALFHAVFGEVDRLLESSDPGLRYTVRYGRTPCEPVISLQSELTAYSFALAARGVGLIAHACAFVTPAGEGVLCPGVSGTGKTTLARLIATAEPSVRLLSDDRAIVTVDAGGVRVWGSPWPGAARVAGVESAPLTTLVFIRHGTAASTRRLPASDAFRRIVNTLSMPLWEPARCGAALETVDAIVSRSRLVEVTYPATAEAAQWLVREVDGRVLEAVP